MSLTYRHTKIAAYLGYVTQAIVNNLAPLLFVSFSHQFSLSLSQISILITLNFGVQVLTDSIAAKKLEQIGYRKACVLAHLLAAVGLIGYAVLPFYLSPMLGLCIVTVILAIGGGLTEVIISPIVEALPGDEKASAMSLLHSFYCWGQMAVVLGSTLYFQLFGSENWRLLPVFWAILPACNFVLFTKVPIRQLDEDGKAVPLRVLVKNRLFWIFLMLMFCSGAAEISMSQWASLFAEEGLQVSKTVGNLLGPCAFACLMGLARTVYGIYGSRLPLERMLYASGILCILSYALAVWSPHPLLALVGCAMTGLAVGMLWPGTYSLSAERFPQGGAAMFAILALAGDVGCTTGPSVVGWIGEQAGDLCYGLAVAIAFPVMLLIGLTCLRSAAKKKRHRAIRNNVTVRAYRPSDCAGMAMLFHETVHIVNAADYTQEQLDAWSSGTVDLVRWNAEFMTHETVIAEVDGQLVGFGDMTADGYLDRLYVHKDFQRQGIATAICDRLESGVNGSFRTHASMTAKPFFLARGYRVVREQQVERHGVWLTNFVMEKP